MLLKLTATRNIIHNQHQCVTWVYGAFMLVASHFFCNAKFEKKMFVHILECFGIFLYFSRHFSIFLVLSLFLKHSETFSWVLNILFRFGESQSMSIFFFRIFKSVDNFCGLKPYQVFTELKIKPTFKTTLNKSRELIWRVQRVRCLVLKFKEKIRLWVYDVSLGRYNDGCLEWPATRIRSSATCIRSHLPLYFRA